MTAAPTRFAAGMAATTLALFIVAQTSAGLHVALVSMFYTMAVHGVNDTRALSGSMKSIGPALILASAVIGAAVALFVARAWAWALVKDRGAGGIGMVAPSRRQLLLAILAGVTFGAIYLAVAEYVLPMPRGARVGPMAQIAASGPLGRAVFGFVAVLLAPPVEEFLFRGLLLKGFAESWGLNAAALFVSGVFVLLHLTEVLFYWPALIAIMTLTVATLAARLMTGSVVAAMALHAAYNTTIVMIVFVGS